MLDTIRNAVNSWIAKVFLGILLLCFALLWGVPELRESTGNDLLISGKSKIKVDTYRLALGDQTMRVSVASNLGRMLTPGEAQQYGIPQFVLNQLQQDVLFDEQARLMKIGVSKDGIARAIGADSFFHQQGGFNRNLFLNYLQQLRVSEADLVAYYATKEKRDQLVFGAVGGMKAPDVFYSALLTYQGETRTADYLVITPKELDAIGDPDQATLDKWFDAHKNEFRAPEYRKVTLMQMTAEELAKPQDISADEAQAYYNQNASRFIAPEKRTIQELRFNTRSEADSAAKKLSDGMSFDDLVKSQNQTLEKITKGPSAKTEFPSTIASDVFTLAKGSVSAVINDLQGPVIFRVVDVTPSAPIPFAEAESGIRQTLAQTNAAKAMRENHDAIENARFEGVSLQELSQQYKLRLQDITVDEKAETPEGQTLTDLPQQPILLDAIFQSTEGADMDPIALQGGGYLWYRVAMITPARDRTLDEVRQTAINGWKAEEIQRRLDEKATELAKELDSGKTIDELAETLNLQKQTARGLQRGSSAEVLGTDGVNAVFAGPKGHNGMAKGALADNRILYTVTESVEPLSTSAQSLAPEARKNIDMSIAEDLRLEMLQIASDEHPVKVNTNNYNQILNNLQ
ncbi:peptidyl-prolyl cis-trans isomerase [Bartonella sp. LJL80]